MDLDQLNKKIEWLDEERRKDKTTIAMLVERLTVLEGTVSGAAQDVKAIQSETSPLHNNYCEDRTDSNFAKCTKS
jgi:hypothetical protein